jgi:hypothetical protein
MAVAPKLMKPAPKPVIKNLYSYVTPGHPHYPGSVKARIVNNKFELIVTSGPRAVIQRRAAGPKNRVSPGRTAKIVLPVEQLVDLLPAIRNAIVQMTDKK